MYISITQTTPNSSKPSPYNQSRNSIVYIHYSNHSKPSLYYQSRNSCIYPLLKQLQTTPNLLLIINPEIQLYIFITPTTPNLLLIINPEIQLYISITPTTPKHLLIINPEVHDYVYIHYSNHSKPSLYYQSRSS